jgi:hypothetical protein
MPFLRHAFPEPTWSTDFIGRIPRVPGAIGGIEENVQPFKRGKIAGIGRECLHPDDNEENLHHSRVSSPRQAHSISLMNTLGH